MRKEWQIEAELRRVERQLAHTPVGWPCEGMMQRRSLLEAELSRVRQANMLLRLNIPEDLPESDIEWLL